MVPEAPTFVQGLYVMVVGMIIVFAALALVMWAIMLLDRIFRPKQAEATSVAKPMEANLPVAAQATDPRGAGGDLAAAIATALALRLQEVVGSPAPVRVVSIVDEPSLWAAAGKLY